MNHHTNTLDRPRCSCPCGARADKPNGLCGKCRSRLTWQRQIAHADRAAARRSLRFRSSRKGAMR